MSNTKDTPMDYKCSDCGRSITEAQFKSYGVCDICFDKGVHQKLWNHRNIILTKEDEPIHHTKLKVGKKYVVNGAEYTYDNYSTFWNLRMIDSSGELIVFPQNTEVFNTVKS